MNLDFDNLPLFDVTTRFTLSQQLPISLPFLLDLRETLRSEFPEVSDLPTLEAAPGASPGLVLTSVPGPHGAKFLSNETGVALSVQSNLISTKWIPLPDVESANKYPRYKQAIRPSMARLITAIEELLGPGTVAVSVANMTYQNFIEAEPPLTLSKLTGYLNLFNSEMIAEAEFVYNIELSFKRDVDLRASILAVQPGMTQPGTTGRTGFVVSTTGGVLVEKNCEHPLNELDRVHDSLVKMFGALLTDKACEEWKKK